MKLIQILTDIVCSTLLDPEALDRARRRKGAFTRNCGKLPYWTVMKLLLKNSKRTVSACLDEFFQEPGPGGLQPPAVHSRLSAKPVQESAIPFSGNVLSACWISSAARIP